MNQKKLVDLRPGIDTVAVRAAKTSEAVADIVKFAGKRRRFRRWLYQLRLPRPVRAPLRRRLMNAYELQYQLYRPEGRLFNALERLGYVLDALRECEHGHTEYRVTFEQHWAAIVTYGSEFKSIGLLARSISRRVHQFYQNLPP